jgi:hypothetical protein
MAAIESARPNAFELRHDGRKVPVHVVLHQTARVGKHFVERRVIE